MANATLPSYLAKHDAELATRLVSECLRRGYAVSVYDGDETTVKRSRDIDVIYPAMGSTDEDRIIISELSPNANGKFIRVGTFVLIWGNSEGETIADHTDNAICGEIFDYAGKPWNG